MVGGLLRLALGAFWSVLGLFGLLRVALGRLESGASAFLQRSAHASQYWSEIVILDRVLISRI